MAYENVTSCQFPVVMRNCLKWKTLEWTVDNWANFLENSEKYSFRKGRQQCSLEPQWERTCEIESLTLDNFFDRFKSNEDENSWLYLDYKHISQWFASKLDLLDVSWKDFGYSDKTAKDSTLWIGTKGAHTPCHIDTYGCNLVAQLYGRKRWILFPPSETTNMKPTRVPYEESSVYSALNFSCGCSDISGINDIRMVVLEPGDVLFVPFHWWHYVENLTSAVSINIWIPTEFDNICRVEESLVKYYISSVCKSLTADEKNEILNPNEDDLPASEETNHLEVLSWCLNECRPSKETESTSALLNNKIQQISSKELMDLLKSKCNGKVKVGKERKNTNLRNNIINAFCHPEVISLARQKLFMSHSCFNSK